MPRMCVQNYLNFSPGQSDLFLLPIICGKLLIAISSTPAVCEISNLYSLALLKWNANRKQSQKINLSTMRLQGDAL